MNAGPLLALVLLASGILHVAEAPPPSPLRDYQELAQSIQRVNFQRFGQLTGGRDCASARLLSYRRDASDAWIADQWYVALHMRADAALARLGDRSALCRIQKSFAWMELLWEPERGGYAPRADLDGRNPTLKDLYADDNALVALAYLEAARVVEDELLRERLLLGANRATAYLLRPGLWDETYGGGLWWNDQSWALQLGKPGQPTALLAWVMAEQYELTRNPWHRQHALRALAWLDARLWSAHHGLYAYGVTGPETDPYVKPSYFSYDQAIVMEALLALYRVDRDPTYLARARALARSVDRAFWQRDVGGYTLEAGNRDVYASYSVWVSEALISLYFVDADPSWRGLAARNFDTVERLLARGDGTYANRIFPCRPMYCGEAQPYTRDRVVLGKGQALMQRVAAMLALSYRDQLGGASGARGPECAAVPAC